MKTTRRIGWLILIALAVGAVDSNSHAATYGKQTGSGSGGGGTAFGWDAVQHARCQAELGTQTTDYDWDPLLHSYAYDASIGTFAQVAGAQMGVLINGAGSSELTLAGQKFGVGPIFPIDNMLTRSYCVSERMSFPIAPLAGSHFTEFGLYDVSGNNGVVFTMYTTDSTTVMHVYQTKGGVSTNTAGSAACTIGSGVAVNVFFDAMIIWNAQTSTLKAQVNGVTCATSTTTTNQPTASGGWVADSNTSGQIAVDNVFYESSLGT